MNWGFLSKPIRFVCGVGGGQSKRPLLLLRTSTHKTAAAGKIARELNGQRSRRYLYCSNLECCDWSAQHTYSKTSKLSTSTLWLPRLSRHVCQAASLLDVKAVAHNGKVPLGAHVGVQKQLTMDYTALVASTQELKTCWIPAKVAQVHCFLPGRHDTD